MACPCFFSHGCTSFLFGCTRLWFAPCTCSLGLKGHLLFAYFEDKGTVLIHLEKTNSNARKTLISLCTCIVCLYNGHYVRLKMTVVLNSNILENQFFSSQIV